MRTILMLPLALLLTARPAMAQATQGAPAQAAALPAGYTGTVDFGGLFTGTDGDAARYERYRDFRNGVYSNIKVNRDTTSMLFDASAYHIGYRDQRYEARLFSAKVNFNFDWTSLPLNYSYLTSTPYTSNGGVLTLPDGARQAVEGPTNSATDGAVGVPCAPGGPPGACGNATQAAQAITNRSIYNAIADQFDLRHRRDTAALGLTYAATHALDVDASFTSTGRSGQQPYGASFAFNTAVEVPLPIDQRTNDVTVGATWRNDRSMLRVGWDGSWFNNAIKSLTWDNPIRITDFNNGITTYTCPATGTGGPWDCSGYSNGNGPAQGRMSTAPNNTMNVLSAVGMYKLPGRTTLNGTLQFTDQSQNDPLIPWTINSVIDTPATFVNFPNLAALPRATAEAEAKGLNGLINLSARPARRMSVSVRYRYNKRDVQTPPFDATEYVRFDAVPEEIEEGITPQFDNSRHLFDANVSFTPSHLGTLRAGYGHEQIHRTGRGFADVGEHIVRFSWDTYSSQWVTVRAAFDYGRRRGSGFVEAISGNDEPDLAVGPGGTQPTLRYYDEADRNRARGSVIVSVMPRDTFDVYVQFAGGKDEYLPDSSFPVDRPGELFGLHDASNTSTNVGVNVHPTSIVSFGANYGRDTYGSFQLSRNANPPPDPTWTDPTRDWTLDNDDTINTATVYLDLLRAVRKTDIRFAYNYSDSTNSFVHGGPRIASLSAAGQFIPLPNVDNTWHQITADVQYFLTSRTGIGVGYYFEKLAISDYDTIDTNGPVGFTPATGVPRIDWLGALTLGYGNRPYTGNTAYLRVLYRF